MNQNYELAHLKDYIFNDISKKNLKEQIIAEMEGLSLRLLGEENDILFAELKPHANQRGIQNSKSTQKLFFKFEETSDEIKVMTYFDATFMNKIMKIINIVIPVIDVFIALILVFFFMQSGNSEMSGTIISVILIFSILPMLIVRKILPKSFKSNLFQLTDRIMQNLSSVKHVK